MKVEDIKFQSAQHVLDEIYNMNVKGGSPFGRAAAWAYKLACEQEALDSFDALEARMQELSDKLRAAGIRVETDLRNEKIGFKIREAQVQKVPYMIVLDDREVEERCTSVRHRSEGDLGSMSVDEMVERLKREIAEKKI